MVSGLPFAGSPGGTRFVWSSPDRSDGTLAIQTAPLSVQCPGGSSFGPLLFRSARWLFFPPRARLSLIGFPAFSPFRPLFFPISPEFSFAGASLFSGRAGDDFPANPPALNLPVPDTSKLVSEYSLIIVFKKRRAANFLKKVMMRAGSASTKDRPRRSARAGQPVPVSPCPSVRARQSVPVSSAGGSPNSSIHQGVSNSNSGSA